MIAELVLKRWSPLAFEKTGISSEMVDSLFEAAGWAPSSMNEQPWIYFYALRDEEDNFERLAECLVPGNRLWAKEAAMLVLSVAIKKFSYKERPNRHAMHDTGAANALLALQAASLGLQAHQMGGFDMEKTMALFGLDPERHEPASFIALGYPGDPDLLPDELRKRELSARTRKEISSFVFNMDNQAR